MFAPPTPKTPPAVRALAWLARPTPSALQLFAILQAQGVADVANSGQASN